MKKRKTDPALPLSPTQRLYEKVAALGDDTPLELDEVCAFWGVGLTSGEKIVAELPVAVPLSRVRRWRYGDVRKHFIEMVKDKVS